MSINNDKGVSTVPGVIKQDINDNLVNLIDTCGVIEDSSVNELVAIGDLQYKRYRAAYNITLIKQKLFDIEKRELNIMKESTMQHSEIQNNYHSSKDEGNHMREIVVGVAQRLGYMKYTMKMLQEQVCLEQQKLEILDEELKKVSKRLEENENEENSEVDKEIITIEEQRDQQVKLLEDLEFKELEIQSVYEDESEHLKKNLFDTLKKFLMSSNYRESRQVKLDEQQIRLMKRTRQALDTLEGKRNHYSNQIVGFENEIKACNLKIEEMNKLSNMSGRSQFNQNGSRATDEHEYDYLTDCTSNRTNTLDASQPAHFDSGIFRNCSLTLDDKLEALTEIVRLNLNLKSGHLLPPSQKVHAWLLDLTKGQDTDQYLMATAPTNDLSPTPSETISTGSASSSLSPLVGTGNGLNRKRSGSWENHTSPSTNNTVHIGDDKNFKSRPLTCFLPKWHSDFNLRQHIESCGHDLEACKDKVQVDRETCQGFLWKLSRRRFSIYRKRWFLFDHSDRELRYYSTKSKHTLKGIISFKSIYDVFVDHLYRDKFPKRLSFCIETRDKTLYLIASRLALVSLWVDVIFTGAEGYLSVPLSDE